MEKDCIELPTGVKLKYWRVPIFFFIVSFSIALYAAINTDNKYCDDGLIVLGTNTGSQGKLSLIEDSYTAAVYLNMIITGINNSIKGIVHINAEAFEVSKQRIVQVRLEGADPRAVRAALKDVLEKFYSAHEKRSEPKYAQAQRDYAFLTKKQEDKRRLLERIVFALSADKFIPVIEYQQYINELTDMNEIVPPVRTKTIVAWPDNTEAKLCESKTILERILLSAGWGFIGSLMSIFYFQILTFYLRRG